MKKMTVTEMMQANGGAAVYVYSYYAFDFNAWRLRRRDVYKDYNTGRSYWVYAS